MAKSNRGGPRPNAGRKSREHRAKAMKVATAALDADLSPLAVMISVMKRHYEAGEWDKALDAASKAAPYVHPKLAAVEHSTDNAQPLFVFATYDQDV